METVLFVIGLIIYAFFMLIIGVAVGMKAKSNQDDENKAGILWINPGKDKDQYQFIFTAPLDDLPKKKNVWLEVQLAEKTGTLMEDNEIRR